MAQFQLFQTDIIGPFDGASYSIEPGCYVDGHWGIYANYRFAQQFTGFLTSEDYDYIVDTNDPELRTNDVADIRCEIIDEAVERINDALPDGYIAHWADGEFYISENCGNEEFCCDNESCFCQYM